MDTQTPEQLQAEIWNYLEQIEKWDGNSNYSLEAVNKKFLSYLTIACRNNISALHADFELPDYGDMGIISSADGNLRIYWWHTRLHDIAKVYNAMAQYSDGTNVETKILNDASIKDQSGNIKDNGGYYKSIDSIKRKNGQTIYMAINVAIAGVPYIPETVRAFTIENGILADTKAFKIDTETYSKLEIEYDQFEGLENKAFHFSENRETMYMPELNNLMFTGKYHVFAFDGNNYVFDKNVK